MTPRERFIPALIAGCSAGILVAALLWIFFPERLQGPSLAEIMGWSPFQVVLLVLGVGLATFIVATWAQWPQVLDWYRSRVLERACRQANGDS